MTLGERIRKRRGKTTRAALAARVGVQPQQVYRWEIDAAAPEARHIAALAREFGVSADWLLGIGKRTSSSAA